MCECHTLSHYFLLLALLRLIVKHRILKSCVFHVDTCVLKCVKYNFINKIEKAYEPVESVINTFPQKKNILDSRERF